MSPLSSLPHPLSSLSPCMCPLHSHLFIFPPAKWPYPIFVNVLCLLFFCCASPLFSYVLYSLPVSAPPPFMSYHFPPSPHFPPRQPSCRRGKRFWRCSANIPAAGILFGTSPAVSPSNSWTAAVARRISRSKPASTFDRRLCPFLIRSNRRSIGTNARNRNRDTVDGGRWENRSVSLVLLDRF